MIIRTIVSNDAAEFLHLKTQLDHETPFMMYEPGERVTTVEEERAGIEHLLASGNSAIFVAELAGRLVGYIAAEGGAFRRVRHKAYVTAGVLQAHSGQGIGTRLFAELEYWAHEHCVRRLELSVQVLNAAGAHLYSKMGFAIEGTLRRSMRVDGQFIDEYLMAKLLD